MLYMMEKGKTFRSKSEMPIEACQICNDPIKKDIGYWIKEDGKVTFRCKQCSKDFHKKLLENYRFMV
jgi:hypothetical protein